MASGKDDEVAQNPVEAGKQAPEAPVDQPPPPPPPPPLAVNADAAAADDDDEDDDAPLPEPSTGPIEEANQYDVLIGRGTGANMFPGERTRVALPVNLKFPLPGGVSGPVASADLDSLQPRNNSCFNNFNSTCLVEFTGKEDDGARTRRFEYGGNCRTVCTTFAEIR